VGPREPGKKVFEPLIRRFESPHPLLILALFTALTLAWAWPLPTQFASRVAFDPGDPMLNAWILWWNAHTVPFTENWWNPPIFYPMRGALALSEHLAGVGFFTSPLLGLGGSPALAYNVALVLSGTLSGLFTYLLLKRLGGSTTVSLCGGLAFAFAPFRAGQLSHLQVLSAQWLPLMLLALHAYVETNRRTWLILFGIGWILQSLSNGYYLLFAPALIVAWIVWFAASRDRWRQTGEIVAAWAAASVALLPVLVKYRHVHGALGLARSPGEIQQFSAHIGSFLNPSPMLAFWPPRNVPVVEDYLFPGLTPVVVVAAALVIVIVRTRSRRSAGALTNTFLFYVAAALFMAALTLGPAPADVGVSRWLKPYEWLVHVPGFNGVRVPARYGMLMALCLAVACGLGLELTLRAVRLPRAFVTAVVALGLLLDGAIKPLIGSPPPGRVELPKVPAAAVLEFPPDDNSVNVGAMFRSMSHRQPLINGYSGHVPAHYAILGQSLRRGDPSAVIELARGRTLLLLVAERNDPAGDFRRLIESIPGVERGELSTAGWSYVLRAQPRDYRPHAGMAHAFTATYFPRRHVVLDLGAPRVVRTLEFPLRDRYPDLDARLEIEASSDGVQWKTVWQDWTAGAALAGALEDERVVPVRVTLPDIGTRFLRIHPAADWLINELTVAGP
jgi:hypothetical protein